MGNPHRVPFSSLGFGNHRRQLALKRRSCQSSAGGRWSLPPAFGAPNACHDQRRGDGLCDPREEVNDRDSRSDHGTGQPSHLPRVQFGQLRQEDQDRQRVDKPGHHQFRHLAHDKTQPQKPRPDLDQPGHARTEEVRRAGCMTAILPRRHFIARPDRRVLGQIWPIPNRCFLLRPIRRLAADNPMRPPFHRPLRRRTLHLQALLPGYCRPASRQGCLR